MKSKVFGATGAMVCAIGQGTWDMPERGPRLEEAKRAIARGIELGMTHIDTAQMYGSGRVEELLGEAIRGVARERLFIATKVRPGDASYSGTLAAADRSLKRLRCGYLDLYLLHWPGSVPLEETMRAFETLVQQGKTRFVGVSNFDAEEMLEAAGYLRNVPLACNQVLYHLGERGVEHRLVPLAAQHRIAIVAYTPFGRGRVGRADLQPGGALDRVARKHDATPRQVVLAFLTREANVFTIPKAARVEHVEENARAADLVLDASDVALIDEAFPRGRAGPLATL